VSGGKSYSVYHAHHAASRSTERRLSELTRLYEYAKQARHLRCRKELFRPGFECCRHRYRERRATGRRGIAGMACVTSDDNRRNKNGDGRGQVSGIWCCGFWAIGSGLAHAMVTRSCLRWTGDCGDADRRRR
jgi:hypothetical protein